MIAFWCFVSLSLLFIFGFPHQTTPPFRMSQACSRFCRQLRSLRSDVRPSPTHRPDACSYSPSIRGPSTTPIHHQRCCVHSSWNTRLALRTVFPRCQGEGVHEFTRHWGCVEEPHGFCQCAAGGGVWMMRCWDLFGGGKL